MKIRPAIISVIFVLLLVPFPMPGKTGAYNKISGLYWCSTIPACIHEVGHKLDDEANWVSHSYEFSLTVSAFVWHEIAENDPPHPYVYKIMKFPGVFRNTPSIFTDDNAELYASIFEWSDGKKENVPEIFHPFYDWDRAQELIEKIER